MAEYKKDTYHGVINLIDPSRARSEGILTEKPVFFVPYLDGKVSVIDIGTVIKGQAAASGKFGLTSNPLCGRRYGFLAQYEAGVIEGYGYDGFGISSYTLVRQLKVLEILAFCIEKDVKVHEQYTFRDGVVNDYPYIAEGIVVARYPTDRYREEASLVPLCGAEIHGRDPVDVRYRFHRNEDGIFQFLPPRGVEVQ